MQLIGNLFDLFTSTLSLIIPVKYPARIGLQSSAAPVPVPPR
jgi:hypothetical protein